MALIRGFAVLATLGLLALAAYWGLGLYRTLAGPTGQGAERPAVAGGETETIVAETAAAASTTRRWVALFGEPQPPKPAAPPQPPAAPATPLQPPSPPLDSQGYSLKGVVSSGGSQWAIVAHPAGDVILRIGEELTDGLYLRAITEEGLVLGPAGGDPAAGDAQKLLRFPE